MIPPRCMESPTPKKKYRKRRSDLPTHPPTHPPTSPSCCLTALCTCQPTHPPLLRLTDGGGVGGWVGERGRRRLR